VIQFVVYGHPEPQGSKQTFIARRKSCPHCDCSFLYKDEATGKDVAKLEVECPKCHKFLPPIVADDSKGLSTWRQELTRTALETTRGPLAAKDLPFPKGIAVAARFSFYLQRPASAPRKVAYPTVRPDAKKLARAVADALSGVLYHDDGQIVWDLATKDFGNPERVEIAVWACGDPIGALLSKPRAETLELFGTGVR
jgi:Holliday junction resolvase RusA-like endonuclease